MKINPILQKIESKYSRLRAKKRFEKNLTKGAYISVIYFDIERERLKIQQFIGFCKNIKSKGVNTKFEVYNSWGQTGIYQQFFLYSPTVIDIAILRNKK